MYFDKNAVVDVGDVVFEGGNKNKGRNEETTGVSNPTYIPNETSTSAPEMSEIQGLDSPRMVPETAPTLPEASKLPKIPKLRRNTLSSLPQYDPAEYG